MARAGLRARLIARGFGAGLHVRLLFPRLRLATVQIGAQSLCKTLFTIRFRFGHKERVSRKCMRGSSPA